MKEALVRLVQTSEWAALVELLNKDDAAALDCVRRAAPQTGVDAIQANEHFRQLIRAATFKAVKKDPFDA